MSDQTELEQILELVECADINAGNIAALGNAGIQIVHLQLRDAIERLQALAARKEPQQ